MAAGKKDTGDYVTSVGGEGLQPAKAYRGAWMLGPSAKPVRVLAEFMEPESRLSREGVKNTLLFFGSARAKSREDWEGMKRELEAELEKATTEEAKEDVNGRLTRLMRIEWMCEYYDKIVELSKRLTEWSLARRKPNEFESYTVATGGGPGMMEAANKGAFLGGGRSIGLGISLPFESRLNRYVTPELSFLFHYFFSRKFWLVNPAVALMVCPGGLGTMDELFETTTLLQTKKMGGKERKYLQEVPIVLIGKEYWKKVLNIEAAVEYGTCSESDTSRLFYTDDVDEAFDYVVQKLELMERLRDEEERALSITGERLRLARLSHLESSLPESEQKEMLDALNCLRTMPMPHAAPTEVAHDREDPRRGEVLTRTGSQTSIEQMDRSDA